MKKIEILECTLRDGSYAIDYQFSAKDTAIIALALENVGFKYIEIGHGLGLNASRSKGVAAETDEIYLKTARDVLTTAKFGMFFIPYIGRKEDLDLAAKYEMDFVRVGTNVTEADKAEEYIKYAKDLGMLVCSNLMKTYALPPENFAEKASLVEEYGADIIFIVDSAGGMMPEDIRKYIEALNKRNIQAKIGFHGHNNLLMGIPNALEAINCGATIIDTSLKGIGRSAGNVPTEIFLAVLKKKGYDLGIDLFKTMDIAEELIKPIMKANVDADPIAITAGIAEFHSSFLNTIYKASEKYYIDPRKLIVSVCEVDKVNVPEELAMKLAEQLQMERAALSNINKIKLSDEIDIPMEKWQEDLTLQDKINALIKFIRNLAL
ncbi:MAG: 4-hydroxy-2-oxovalerate aldolase, partial [Promethearchaeota archaeon]